MAIYYIKISINPVEAQPYCKWRIGGSAWFNHNEVYELVTDNEDYDYYQIEGLGENGWYPFSNFGNKYIGGSSGASYNVGVTFKKGEEPSETPPDEEEPPSTPPPSIPDDFDWFDSGHRELVEPGQYTIRFKDISGWIKPNNITGMNVLLGDELVRSGTYLQESIIGPEEPEVPWPDDDNTYDPPEIITEDDIDNGGSGGGSSGGNTGKLTIFLKIHGTEEQLSDNTGAGWRIVGTSNWYPNGHTLTGIVVNDVGWISVEVIAKTIDGYQEQTDILNVKIFPGINSQRKIYYYPLTEDQPENKESWIIRAYATLGRGPSISSLDVDDSAFDPKKIDQEGFDHWKKVIADPERNITTYEQFKLLFDEATEHWFTTKPNHPVVLYVKDYLGESDGEDSTSDGSGRISIKLYPSDIINKTGWRRIGTSNWYKSGDTERNIPMGDFSIEYKEVIGYKKPSNSKHSITAHGHLITIDKTYTESSSGGTSSSSDKGNLKINLTPSSIGGKWRISGSSWKNSGYTEKNIPIGRISVDFKSVSGYVTPSSKKYTIEKNQTAIYSVGYKEIEEDTTPPPTVDLQKQAEEWVIKIYGTVKRGPSIGSKPSQIDQGGFNSWVKAAKKPGVTYSNLLSEFQDSVKDYIASNPNDPYSLYIKDNNPGY